VLHTISDAHKVRNSIKGAPLMKKLFESVSKIINMNEAKDPAKMWAKKPLAPKAAKMKDPVHVEGMGVMEREQAQRLFPTMKHTPINLYKEEAINEANVGRDTVTMTIPLFIRCLEWAKENAKDDIEIHKFVENVISKTGTLATDDYESLVPNGSIKEGDTSKSED
jgi:hypothetical protein